MGKFASLAESARAVATERAELVRAIETLKQERDALLTAPLPRKDFIRRLEAYIDGQAARFDRNLEAAVAVVINRPSIELQAIEHGFPLLKLMNADEAGLDERLVVSVLGEAMKSRVRSIVERMEWPAAGPPLSDREARRTALDLQISGLEMQLREIDEVAVAAKGAL